MDIKIIVKDILETYINNNYLISRMDILNILNKYNITFDNFIDILYTDKVTDYCYNNSSISIYLCIANVFSLDSVIDKMTYALVNNINTDSYNILTYAVLIKRADTFLLADAIINKGNIRQIINFAIYIDKAPVDKLFEYVLVNGSPHEIIKFLLEVNNSDINRGLDVILESDYVVELITNYNSDIPLEYLAKELIGDNNYIAACDDTEKYEKLNMIYDTLMDKIFLVYNNPKVFNRNRILQ